MRRTTAMVACGLAAVLAPVGAGAAPSGSVPGAATFPESITVVPGSSTYFVSSFLSGAVVRGTVGQPAQPFLPAGSDGRRSAAGIHADAHGHLLVLDGARGRLQTYAIADGRLQSTLAVAGPSEVNDVT